MGFVHGFLTLSEPAEVLYKAGGYWSKACERSIRSDDPELAIAWPLERLGGIEPLAGGKGCCGAAVGRGYDRRGRCSRDREPSRPRNTQVRADLANEQLFDFVVPGNGAAAIERGLMPPGMIAAFSKQAAAVLAEVA